METNKQGFFKEIQHLAEEYIRERLLLLKLQTAEKVARMAAVVVAGAFIGIFVIIVLLLLTFLACYFFEQLTGSWYYGVGIVILFYLILIAFLVYLRKTLLYNFVSNSVIKMFFEETDDTTDIIDDAPKA
jgi:polyferredoxin